MSTPPTLRVTCLNVACGFLKSGAWEECRENPFSCMPVSIVHEILSCVWPAESALNRDSIGHSRLLLTSGRLEYIVLKRIENVGDYATLLRMLSRGCQNLRRLSILDRRYERTGNRIIEVELALQELLHNCAKLEHLHSCIYFNPNHLMECRNIKNIRLHFRPGEETVIFSRQITSDLLNRLRSVEEFTFCRSHWYISVDTELHITCAILENCPQLTSLGFLDSSEALKKLHNLRKLGTSRYFQLRRCYWGFKGFIMPKSEFCDKIRVAALSCPMLEVLVIDVIHARCLRNLNSLRKLTFLFLNFFLFKDYEPELHSLLDAIGSQLRHLSIYGSVEIPFNVNIIYKNCPNLKTLLLDCPVTTDEAVEPCVNLLKLERLSVLNCDPKTLFFLLWNSLHLKVLCLQNCMELEDDVMQVILRKNPFVELEVAFIRGCSLSEVGWKMFIQSAQKLTKFCLYSRLLGHDELMRCVRDLNPSAVGYHTADLDELKIEQFLLNFRMLNKISCWL